MIIVLIDFKKNVYFRFARTIRRICTLFHIVNCINIDTFQHLVKIMLFLKRLIITSFKSKTFNFIKRFILQLLTMYIFLINLIIIDFFFDVFLFIKKENVIYLLMKYRLKSISRKVIVDLCFFITKKNINRFKNNLLFIFIKHFVLRQLDLREAFLKKLKNSIK